jgi:hypothetical protein
MRIVLDSSVLLLLLQRRQPGWEQWREFITPAASEERLVICAGVFAECSIGFPSAEVAPSAFESIQVFFDPISYQSA